jgi:predicted DCC family thiol-disulfide oxidoreductase YuxK
MTSMDRTNGRPGSLYPGIPNGSVLIDGKCVLCAASFRFVAQRDSQIAFQFTSIQSGFGQRTAERLGINPDDPDTFAVVLEGRLLVKSEGALEILRRLPGWQWSAVLLMIPRSIRDWIYDRIARNRYRLFGRLPVCMVPTEELASHFIAT